MQAEFLYNPDSSGAFGHCPFLLELPESGEVLAAWYSYPGPHDYQDAKLVIARRSRQAQWSKARVLFEGFQSSAGNPLLIYDSTQSRLILLFVLIKGKYWNDALMHSSYSQDFGRTWSEPQVAWPEKGLMIRHRAVEIEPGQFLLPAYDEITNHSLLLRGDGLNWELCEAFPDVPLIQPVLIRESNGRLTLFFRPTLSNERIIWRAHSNDRGKSWSTVIRTSLLCPLSAIDAFAIGKNIAVIHNPFAEKRYPLVVSLSKDGGISFPIEFMLDNSEHEVSYPSFQISEQGRIFGSYSYNRRMIKFLEIESAELEQCSGENSGL